MIQDSKNAIEFKELKEGIKFENLSFAYTKDKDVLKNINMEVKKGETLALVGNSGGGKTTLVNLLARFYGYRRGKILIK